MKKTWKITALPVLVVFALFALSLLGVLLTGADTYDALVRRGEAGFAARTAVQYLTTRIHQADSRGSLALEPFGDTHALTVREQVEETAYLTRIYVYDGWLRELYTREDVALAPEDGEPLLQMEGAQFCLEDGMVSAALTLPGGEIRELKLYLRSTGEVRP